MESHSNQPELTIKPIVQSDVPKVVKLIGDIWAEYGCVLDTSIEEQYLLTPGQYFHERNGEFWVVKAGNRIVATVAVTFNDDNVAELKSLYVHRDQRGSGLGERLTRMAIELAKEQGAREMVLWTDTRFTKAHRLYERMGFAKTGSRRLDDINNTTEFGFSLTLG